MLVALPASGHTEDIVFLFLSPTAALMSLKCELKAFETWDQKLIIVRANNIFTGQAHGAGHRAMCFLLCFFPRFIRSN